MDYLGQFQGQLLDPFRIGLLIALLATMHRTRAATGTLIPLAAGALFVAVIIPATLSPPETGGMIPAILTGFVANALLLGLMLAALNAFNALRGK